MDGSSVTHLLIYIVKIVTWPLKNSSNASFKVFCTFQLTDLSLKF